MAAKEAIWEFTYQDRIGREVVKCSNCGEVLHAISKTVSSGKWCPFCGKPIKLYSEVKKKCQDTK